MLDNSKKEYALSELLAMTREELLAIAAEMIQAASDEIILAALKAALEVE